MKPENSRGVSRFPFFARYGSVFFFLLTLPGGAVADENPFRPTPGKFPPLTEAKTHRGELVFVDHVNRRGSLRLHVDGHFREGKLHHFAMLPYGMVFYHGSPASLADIPLGTVLSGKFFLPPSPETSAVPLSKGNDVTQPAETHALLLEDVPSLCLRHGRSWKLDRVEISDTGGTLFTSIEFEEDEMEKFHGDHSVTIDRSTRIWRGRELLGIDDLIEEGTWPTQGEKSMGAQPVHLSLTWHPRYLYQQFHASDLWLDEIAMKSTSERQRGRHIRHTKMRWMPAIVDSVDHGKFGAATVTVTLYGGSDESLYADFEMGTTGTMAAAEETLRTWWPDHDGMDGKFVAVQKLSGDPPMGSSGIQVSFEVDLVLEGFRPGRTVRIRPQSWPKVKPPVEELIKGTDSRWPGHGVFRP